MKLGGIMVWSFETDDLKNACGGGRLPILATIRKNLKVIKYNQTN